MTFYLSAVEPRVKVMAPFVVALNAYGVGTNKLYDWAMPSVLAPWHYAKAIAGRPFLMMMDTNDPFYTEQEARKLFDLVSGDSKTLKFYYCEGGHCLPMEHANDAVLWFTENL